MQLRRFKQLIMVIHILIHVRYVVNHIWYDYKFIIIATYIIVGILFHMGSGIRNNH